MRLPKLMVVAAVACSPAAAAIEDEFAPAALRLCVAMQLDRHDDGVAAADGIADAVVASCAGEIDHLASLLDGSAGHALQSQVRRDVAAGVRALRGGL